MCSHDYKRMAGDNYCSPLCIFWDECDAMGYLRFVKIVIQDPYMEVKDWCPSLTLPLHLNIGGEPQKE